MRVTVIGAGFGGLSAALLLAEQGIEVTVLEAGSGPGGKAGRVEVDGVTFDTGPSLLTMPEVPRRLFSLVGESFDDHVELLSPSPAFRYLYPDGTALDVHHELADTIDSIRGALGSGPAREMTRFMAYARRIWEAAAPPFVAGDAPSPSQLMSLDVRTVMGLRHIDAMRTMWGAIRKQVRSPHLRSLLARYATYNGSDVRKAPATLNCIAHVELAMGGYGVRGGLAAVVDAMADACGRHGVRFLYNTPATGIEIESGRVRSVRTPTGAAIQSDAVVCNADARHLFEDLLPAPVSRKDDSEPSMSGWTAVIKASKRPRAPHTVVFPETYLDEFVDIFDRGTAPQTPTVYACDQSAAHGREGWGDASPLFVMINAPPTRADDKTDWKGAALKAIDTLQARDLIDPDDPIVWTRTPAMLAQRFPGSRGGIYGAASNSPWSAFRRPQNRVPDVEGLYLATGSAHPGGGVPMCMLSGMAAVRAVLKDSGLDRADSFAVAL